MEREVTRGTVGDLPRFEVGDGNQLLHKVVKLRLVVRELLFRHFDDKGINGGTACVHVDSSRRLVIGDVVDEPVVARAAIDDVVAAAAVQDVGTTAAVDLVSTGAAVDIVRPGAAGQFIAAIAAVNRVAATDAVDHVALPILSMNKSH